MSIKIGFRNYTHSKHALPVQPVKQTAVRGWFGRVLEVTGQGAKKVAGWAGDAFEWAAKGAANTTMDAVRWSSKRVFNKFLDVTAWVAKGAVVAYLATTAVTAVGAAISPVMTAKVVDSFARTLGATPLDISGVESMGDTFIIQAQYTGDLLAKALKGGIELGAKSVVYTAQAGYTYVAKPLVAGFAGAIGREMEKAWSAAKGLFF